MKKLCKSRLVAISGSKVLVMRKVGAALQYTLPGGIKKKHEKYTDALVRETAEEIVLSIKAEELELFYTHTKSDKTTLYTKKYYYINLEPNPIAVIEKHKFLKTLWLDWRTAMIYMDKTDKLAIKTIFKSRRELEMNRVKSTIRNIKTV